MADIRTMACCGLRELTNIGYGTVADALRAVRDSSHTRYKGVIFTEANHPRRKRRAAYGMKLASYIRKHKLGKITKVPRFVNPNTNNRIDTYVWLVDWIALQNHPIIINHPDPF